MAKKKSVQKAAPADTDEASGGMSFEAAVEGLEEIVRRLERGGGTLEEALQDYSRAIELLRECHRKLERAERRVELLSGIDAEGNPVTEPVSDDAESLQEKQAARAERRSAGRKTQPRATSARNNPPRDADPGLF